MYLALNQILIKILIYPDPIIIREKPPAMPSNHGPKKIVIQRKPVPPPPRKVVIERLAHLPSKPQHVIIERWLPYKKQKRRVIFHDNKKPEQVQVKPKNVIIQWESPRVKVTKKLKQLGNLIILYF